LPGAISLYWLSGLVFEQVDDIAALQQSLREKGVPTRRNFVPIVEFPPYHTYDPKDFRNSYYLYDKSLCLPSSTLNSEKEIYAVCQALKAILCP